MRRSRNELPHKLSGDSQRLAVLAQALVVASSRLEERIWERQLDALTEKLLKSDRQATINTALGHLFKSEPGAYEALMESVETVSASCTIERDGQRYEAMLIAVPILAWTRFSIASGPVSGDTLVTLSAHLYAHMLASDAKMAISPHLYAIDQLPRTHCELFALTRRLANAALTGSAVPPLTDAPETVSFLADTRFLLAAVAIPAGAPLFRWHATEAHSDITKEQQQALSQWKAQVRPTMERMLPGCGIELMMPEAYYVACREADKKIRPASIQAAVHYLMYALNVAADELSAIIGGFSEQVDDDWIDEYRISFTLQRQPEVVYGVVWPLYEEDEAEHDAAIDVSLTASDPEQLAGPLPLTPLQEIFRLLRQSGVTDIHYHPERFPMESCEDCDAPLYCDRDAELVHAEMPEDILQTTPHLH